MNASASGPPRSSDSAGARRPRIVVGLGSGRCGTRSLAALLDSQSGSRVFHERAWVLHRQPLAWEGDERAIEAFLSWALSADEPELVGDVAFYYLPYVEHILRRVPWVKFVCLKRDRGATVDSFMVKTRGRNHWIRHDGTEWDADLWDRCYPKYEVARKEEAVGTYWDDYYRKAAGIQERHPRSFHIFPMSALNTTEGQEEILSFLGIPADRAIVHENLRLNRSRWRRKAGYALKKASRAVGRLFLR